MPDVLVVALVVLFAAALVVAAGRQLRRTRLPVLQTWPPAGHTHLRKDNTVNEPHVTRPADLDRTTERELAEGYVNHRAVVVDARLGIGERKPVVRVRASALDALAVGEALVRRMLRERWSTVVDALEYGASLAEVAAALDMDPAGVRAGLAEWADGQRRYASMTAERHAEVMSLLAHPSP